MTHRHCPFRSLNPLGTGEGTTLPGGTVPTAKGCRNYRMDSGLDRGSRLGFRGVEDLGGGLRANFLFEMGINANTGGLNQGGFHWSDRTASAPIRRRCRWACSTASRHRPKATRS